MGSKELEVMNKLNWKYNLVPNEIETEEQAGKFLKDLVTLHAFGKVDDKDVKRCISAYKNVKE